MSLIAGQEVETFLDGSNAKMCERVHLCLSMDHPKDGVKTLLHSWKLLLLDVLVMIYYLITRSPLKGKVK